MENNTPRKKQLPAFLILGIIALVAAVVLALTNALTKGPIAEHKMAALKEAFNAVMPADSYEEMTLPAGAEVSSLYAAKNGGEVVGYCVTAVGKGYNGDVAVTLGVGTDGLVTGCAVGDTSFAETAGFGARAKEPAFQEQFVGIDAVNGGSFEALSGATVTSKAVLDATNKALRCVDSVALNKEPAADPLVTFGAPAEKPVAPAAPLTGNVQSATAKGFASDVKVELTVDASGAISGLTVDATGETEGFGTRCTTDEAFLAQFIGKTGPFTLGENADALSGATITSTAVVEAVNAALEAPASAGGNSGSATAQGFQSEVTVTVTLEEGAIASILVDSNGETPNFGTRCTTDEAFLAQFIGKTAPLTLGENVDALSGATVTSTAVVEAANAAIKNAASAPAEAPATVIAEDDGAALGLKDNGTAVLEGKSGFTGTVTATLNVENGKVTDGTVASKKPSNASWTEDGKATSFAKGMESNVTATLSLNEDGTIAELKLNTLYETEYFGDKVGSDTNFVNQFIGKAAPFTLGEGIDAVTNATITSKACIEAINDAAAFAAGGAPAPVKEEEAPVETKDTNASWTEDGKATSFAKGVESNVTATLSLNEDGTIAELKLNTLYETEYFGDKVGSDTNFVNQFIGKAAPFTLGDGIDAVTNATITSKACIEAINDAAAFAASGAPAPAKEEPTEEEQPAAAELTAAVEGFESDVKVTVTLDAEGKIATLAVDSSDETPGLGQRCMEDAFTSQFIGKAAPFTLGDGIDSVSGATITSTAVVEAINKAVSDAAPAEEAAPAAAELTAAVEGFESDVKVTVTLDAEGKIATLAVDSSGETPGLGQRCAEKAFTSQFIGKAAPFTLGDGIDGVSGATITSTAAVEAINKACEEK